jgi:ankyrin repeat protein
MKGVDPTAQSSRYGHLEVSRVLLDHGANVNARKQGLLDSDAHISAANGYLEIVKLLLERGADIHAMNARVKHHTNYRCEKEIERLQIYFGRMARADSEKGSTRSFYDLNALSDWRFDFSP